MELRLYMRQKKTYDLQGNEIHYSGSSIYSLQSQNGPLPNSRLLHNLQGQPIQQEQWIDVTAYVSDIHKLVFMFTAERGSDGSLVSVGQEEKKTVSGVITFEGLSYQYLKKWLVDDVSAVNNVMEVRIDHMGCGSYTDWIIKATDITWCEDDVCTFDVTMQQADEAVTCIRNTVIADNWQGWFPENGMPANGKQHPRFSYCVEARSDAWLVILWWLMGQNISVFFFFSLLIATIWNPIVLVLRAILGVIKFIINITGGDDSKIEAAIENLERSAITPQDIKDIAGNMYLESAGCGREQPAPLIRDYIYNVCAKCGVRVDADTAAIFFSSQINIETSADRFAGRGAQTRPNPHFNACYFASVVNKGVRRYDDIGLFAGVNLNTTIFWLPGNQPIRTLDMFLDELKEVYNARWWVDNNTLYFKRKDEWLTDEHIFDFRDGTADRNLMIKGICYEWNGNKMPAAIEGLYQPDGSDVSGNGSISYYNRAVSTGNSLSNPSFDGTKSKYSRFGTAKFRLDGAEDDYILNAFREVARSSLINGFPWVPQMMRSLFNDNFAKYADYVLLLKQETTVSPKILLWDQQSFINAKCIKPYAAVPINAGSPLPNVPYNNYQGTKQWQQLYPPNTKVGGREIGAPGVYQVNSPWFTGNAYRRDALLVNYPMYFAPEFEGGMWDWFHWIDDPRFNPTLNRTATIRMELCCDTLKRIKPFGNGKDVVLGKKVNLGGAYGEGYITNIDISYDTENEDGMYIELRVNV